MKNSQGSIAGRSQKALRGNALRQHRYRQCQIDDGRLGLKVWIDFDTMQNLRALAHKRRMTLQEAVEAAINGEWEAAGRP